MDMCYPGSISAIMKQLEAIIHKRLDDAEYSIAPDTMQRVHQGFCLPNQGRAQQE
jgi:hypothetical protein